MAAQPRVRLSRHRRRPQRVKPTAWHSSTAGSPQNEHEGKNPPSTTTASGKTDTDIRLRELALQERELTLKEQETEARLKIEKRGLMYSSPLLIALISTVLGTAIGAGLQGYSDGRLERLKFEFSLVQGAFENTEREEAAKQLRFIANSGVVRNLDTDKLRSLADTPEEIPQANLNALSARQAQAYLREIAQFAGDVLVDELTSSGVEPTEGIVTTGISGNAYIRASSSPEGRIRYTVPEGSKVSVLYSQKNANNELWYRTVSDDTGGSGGWINASLVEIKSDVIEVDPLVLPPKIAEPLILKKK